MLDRFTCSKPILILNWPTAKTSPNQPRFRASDTNNCSTGSSISDFATRCEGNSSPGRRARLTGPHSSGHDETVKYVKQSAYMCEKTHNVPWLDLASVVPAVQPADPSSDHNFYWSSTFRIQAFPPMKGTYRPDCGPRMHCRYGPPQARICGPTL